MRKIYARCISFVLVEGHPAGIAVTEKRYVELTARYEKAKAKYDDIAEQIESKKAKRELFKGFIRTLEKQDGLIYEFDAGVWGSLVQEVVVKAKDDIRFIFKNGFELRV